MSNLDKLVAEGAFVCAGSLILGREEVGTLTDGDLTLTQAGKNKLAQLADVTDVEVKTPGARKKKAADVEVKIPAAHKKKAADAVEHVPEAVEPTASLNDLLDA